MVPKAAMTEGVRGGAYLAEVEIGLTVDVVDPHHDGQRAVLRRPGEGVLKGEVWDVDMTDVCCSKMNE
jgi:hypothetical protein